MRLIFALLLAMTIPSMARDNGEWTNAPSNVRDWAKRVRSPQGVNCCDVSDGHKTDYEIRGNAYFIPNPENPEAPWLRIPPEAVITEYGNPVGEAVVWYVPQRAGGGEVEFYIRCFVPGAGL
jgi:hypothetical protein